MEFSRTLVEKPFSPRWEYGRLLCGGWQLDTTTEYVHETPISLTRSDIYDDEKAVSLTHRYGERSYFCGKYIVLLSIEK